MRWHRRHRRTGAPAELDITAFMNLMVILVPFLLITAVFSRITVLELSLPSAAAAKSTPKKKLALEIILREDALEVSDRQRGLIRFIKNKRGHYDLAGLSHTLQQVKAHYPNKTDATILAGATNTYEALVQVMDTVRVVELSENGSVAYAELFPEISIGDAPVATSQRRRKKR